MNTEPAPPPVSRLRKLAALILATPRRRRLTAAAVVVLALAVAAVVTINQLTRPTASGDSLHEFHGGQHAPFLALADYKPIYDRHDPGYVLVDVRPAAVRAESHIPGDIWVPLADAPTTGWQTLQQYRGKAVLVLYCDCPWQEAANESVILRQHGFTDADMRVLHEGIPAWEAAGYPVVRGTDPCADRKWPLACS
ncbi:rhodanese-like domain-containing protein [Nocardia sp. NPDC088792]|uniref:rhodanese-like domain-containing protein n=1 Tax=Nocardia sp. NPDC088792 TaxID=3364332 RepID=UPI0038205B45